MYCTNCGTHLTKEANYCWRCGFKTNNSQPVEMSDTNVAPEVKLERYQWILGWIVIAGIAIVGYFNDESKITNYLGLIGCWLYFVLNKVFFKISRIEQALGISKFVDKKNRGKRK